MYTPYSRAVSTTHPTAGVLDKILLQKKVEFSKKVTLLLSEQTRSKREERKGEKAFIFIYFCSFCFLELHIFSNLISQHHMRLLLQLCTFITFSYVAAFFKPPFFADFFRGLSDSRGPSDEYNRVLKLIEDIATEQAKTDKQLRLLINKNSNRDEELEKLIEEALIKKLKDADWAVSVVDFTEIFRSDGRKLLEWDGILMCRHEQSQKDVLVVIETKQIVSIVKFENFKARLLKMKKAMKNAVVDDDLWPFRDFFLCGVIAGPVIRDEVDTSGFTYITLKEDQYEVYLEPSIFNSTVQ